MCHVLCLLVSCFSNGVMLQSDGAFEQVPEGITLYTTVLFIDFYLR